MATPSNGLVSVSLVLWESEDVIDKCLTSLKRQTYEPIEIVAIDNASSDNSVQIVSNVLPKTVVIQNQVNLGYCVAHNQGISASSGEFVMPLNPDVELAPDFIENLVRVMNSCPKVGIAVGKLYLPEIDSKTGKRLIDETGLFLNKARRQYLRGHGEADCGQYDTAGYVFGASGAAPLYRRVMLEAVNIDGEYLDSTFFAHKEDLDLSWRSQLRGWRAFYEPAAIGFHQRSFRPFRRKQMETELKKHAVKNRYISIVKNDQLSNFLLHLPWIGLYDLIIFSYLILFERSSLTGIGEFVRLLPKVLRKRSRIMQQRVVSAGYIRGLIH